MGAKNVLVSMAGEGAVLIDENGREYMSPVPKGKVVNAVGAGDSMVAGFIAGYLEKRITNMHSTWGLHPEARAHFPNSLRPGLRLKHC